MSEMRKLPKSYNIAQELDWNAPWIEVRLRVELPFWLMMNNTTLSVELQGHTFPVAVNGETFELHVGEVTDSKRTALYQGPIKKIENFSEDLQRIVREHPDLNILWRKCKTVLRITTRCNQDVWDRARDWPRLREEGVRPAVHRALHFYLEELCRAHIPVVNRLIQAYRLATYDYFPFEVSPWDVPIWYIEHSAQSVRCLLAPYRGWDHRPIVLGPMGRYIRGLSAKTDPRTEHAERPRLYQLIEGGQLQEQMVVDSTPGELELLDALNMMERGDYSGAVRRVATAIEVVAEAMVGREIERAEGEGAAAKFLDATKTNFPRRVKKYEALSGRSLPQGLSNALGKTRQLRHRIVHRGYRISSGERGDAQHAVDTGRWTFNWFENNEERRTIREKRIAFRSLGRDIHGVFLSKITPDGVLVSPPRMLSLEKGDAEEPKAHPDPKNMIL